MPLVWFTVDQRWDRTSTDDVLGNVRFGLNATDARLLPWRQVFIDTGVDPAEFIATVERTGADRNEWFAVFGPVTLGDLTFEVLLDESGDWADSLVHDGAAWKPADPAAIARAYIADEARARAERDSGGVSEFLCVRRSETCPRRRASLATNDRRGGQVGAAYYAAAFVKRSA